MFRDLKSGLGLGTYVGTSFEAFERIVDMTLLSYLFLEWVRLASPEAKLGEARLTALKLHVEREGLRADLAYVEKRLRSDRGRRTLARAVRNLREAG